MIFICHYYHTVIIIVLTFIKVSWQSHISTKLSYLQVRRVKLPCLTNPNQFSARPLRYGLVIRISINLEIFVVWYNSTMTISNTDDMMLKNKTIFITGSSRGIGAATARLAVSYGANVILHGSSESEELQNLANELGAPSIIFNVADEDAVRTSISTVISQFGPIHGLVCSAGISEKNHLRNWRKKTGRELWELTSWVL